MSASHDTPPDLLLLLGRIDGKLDMALRQGADHADRIAALEKKQAWMLGAAGVIAALISALLSWININVEAFK